MTIKKKSVPCRVCKTELSISFINLGYHPISNHYLNSLKEFEKEKKYILHAQYCDCCGLVQLIDDIDPSILFDNYAYFSSYSSSWLNHSKIFVEEMIDELNLNKNDFVIEIASNDGYLLKNFLPFDIKVLGIEPSSTVAKAARSIGVETIEKFFNVDEAKEIIKTYDKANLVIANNVIAHTPDPLSMIKGCKKILKTDGILSIEFPHLSNLIKELQFDTIYHEHFSYFSLFSIENLLSYAKLKAIDIKKIPTHGGSLRVLATHSSSLKRESSNLSVIREEEKEDGILDKNSYLNFKNDVLKTRTDFISMIKEFKDNGKKIAAYGAAAKGNTFLNFCEIDHSYIDFVCDLNPHKQNKFLPGTGIPIINPSELIKYKPDYIIILPWNLKDEILKELDYTKKWGCQMITSIPKLKIW